MADYARWGEWKDKEYYNKFPMYKFPPTLHSSSIKPILSLLPLQQQCPLPSISLSDPPQFFTRFVNSTHSHLLFFPLFPFPFVKFSHFLFIRCRSDVISWFISSQKTAVSDFFFEFFLVLIFSWNWVFFCVVAKIWCRSEPFLWAWTSDCLLLLLLHL